MSNTKNFTGMSLPSDQNDDELTGHEAFEILEDVARKARKNGLTPDMLDAALKWVREQEGEPDSFKDSS